jgi:hypothetical protein
MGRAIALAVSAMLAAVLSGCAGAADRTPSLTQLPVPPASTPAESPPGPGATTPQAATAAPDVPAAPASPVTGIVVSVDSAGLADVRGFQLRTADGVVLDLAIGRLENGAEFPPGHLAEHAASSDPVRVYFREEAGTLVVYRIEDAG